MSVRRTGRIVLTVALAATLLGPTVVDFNESHVFNEDWPPHARYHAVMLLAIGMFQGLAGLSAILKDGSTLWETDAIACELARLAGRPDFFPEGPQLPELLRWLSWTAMHWGLAGSGETPDRPVAGTVRDRLNEELLKLWKATGKTIGFVTRSIPEAVYLSTKIVVMSPRPGRIVREARARRQHGRHQARRDALDQSLRAERFAIGDGNPHIGAPERFQRIRLRALDDDP